IPDFAPSAAGRTAAGACPPATRGAFPPRPARASARAAPEGFPGNYYTPDQEEDNSVGSTIGGISRSRPKVPSRPRLARSGLQRLSITYDDREFSSFLRVFRAAQGASPRCQGGVSLHRARGPPGRARPVTDATPRCLRFVLHPCRKELPHVLDTAGR